MIEKIIGSYKNGNTTVTLFKDGTQIKFTKDDFFNWEFPNSMDIKITDKCGMNCKYCHEGSSNNGEHGDLNLPFFDTLHPYTEVAIGGGNILTHPDIDRFLFKLKEKNVIANITLNQVHFLKGIDRVLEWISKDLVKGVGISFTKPSTANEMIGFAKLIPTSVIHVINGIFTERDFNLIKNQGVNLLVLGYKDLRRGHENLLSDSESIRNNKKWLSYNLKEVVESFNAVAFDNLALEQLPVKKLVDKNWNLIYQGADGRESGTMYIDCVKKEFALSSTSDKRYPIMDSIDEMYKFIKEKS